MDALLPHVEQDPDALLEYARLWLDTDGRYRGPLRAKLDEPTTGPWLTRLLVEALGRGA